MRWRSAAYDEAYNAAQSELDPVKRAALLIKCNDLAVSENVLPLIHRAKVSAVGAESDGAPQRLGQRPRRSCPTGTGRPERERGAMGAYILRRLLVAIPSEVRRRSTSTWLEQLLIMSRWR